MVSASLVQPHGTVCQLVYMMSMTLICSTNGLMVDLFRAYRQLLNGSRERCIQRHPTNSILNLNMDRETACSRRQTYHIVKVLHQSLKVLFSEPPLLAVGAHRQLACCFVHLALLFVRRLDQVV